MTKLKSKYEEEDANVKEGQPEKSMHKQVSHVFSFACPVERLIRRVCIASRRGVCICAKRARNTCLFNRNVISVKRPLYSIRNIPLGKSG